MRLKLYFLSNSLDNDIGLEDFGLELPRDLVFIKELINGPIEESQPGYPYRGRGEGWVSPSCVWHLTVWCRTREVLPLRDRQQQTDGCGRGQGGDRVTRCLHLDWQFQWDYFMRDSKATNLSIYFNYTRLITNMKIVDWYYDKYGEIVTFVKLSIDY